MVTRRQSLDRVISGSSREDDNNVAQFWHIFGTKRR